MRISPVLVLLAVLLAPAGAIAGDIDPHELLDRMNEAVRELDYEGRFVVQSDQQLEAMYLVHRADGGAEKERVVSLTGKPREIIRSDQAVACLLPGNRQPINVGRRAHDRSFSPLQGASPVQLDRSYRMRLAEPDRVAGRDVHQLLIEPNDDLRYGYRLFIDQVSALPLRSMMLDAHNEVVSQMMFIDLKVDESITPIERDVSAMQLARPDPSRSIPGERLAAPAWVFLNLPPGFEMYLHRRRSLANAAGELEHFIFSDGLASVSVYIQPHNGETSLMGESSLGAATAVGRVVDGHEVIVVGEVPAKTLHWFAQHVQAARQ